MTAAFEPGDIFDDIREWLSNNFTADVDSNRHVSLDGEHGLLGKLDELESKYSDRAKNSVG